MTSENNCIIEDVDNACVEMPSDEIGVKEHDNFCDESYDDSFYHNCGDASIENVVGNVDCVVDNVHANPLENVGNINAKRNDENCFDTCENNSFNSMENNSIESCVDNFPNSYDSNSSNHCENNSFVSLDDNDGLESFTFGDSSLSNGHVNDLHEILDDDEMNVDASLLELNDVEFVTYHDNCLDDALYIHELIGEDKEEMGGDLRDVLSTKEEEGVEKENAKEEIEDKKKTRNESVREVVEEKFSYTSCSIHMPLIVHDVRRTAATVDRTLRSSSGSGSEDVAVETVVAALWVADERGVGVLSLVSATTFDRG
nr:hypothetical protein Iba_chr03aCG2950 [Ipomoea batatas]